MTRSLPTKAPDSFSSDPSCAFDLALDVWWPVADINKKNPISRFFRKFAIRVAACTVIIRQLSQTQIMPNDCLEYSACKRRGQRA